MRFVVTKACTGGGAATGRARAGALYAGSSPDPIETPALLLASRKGLPSFIPPDLLPSLNSRLLHVSPLHFIENPSVNTISSIGGLHQMVGLHDHVFVATARDSVVCLPQHDGANRIGASFETPTGRRMMKPSAYMELVSSLKPDICGSLADEVPAWVTEKRNRISVDRTLRWLDDCLALEKPNGASILGAVVGGSSIEERKRCATGVAMRNVSGFWIGGFGLGESLEERPALLNTVTGELRAVGVLLYSFSGKKGAFFKQDCLPKENLRQISGLALPEEILQGVAAGIDLFESTYIYHLTLGGFALVFPLDIDERNILDAPQCDMGSDNTKINMRATIYRKDTSPIVNNCSCFTCQNHTRAYINHLLNVHEMLAQTLLEIHNTHHYLGFFGSIRIAIKGGSFESFRQRFMDDRRAHLISAMACS